MELPYISLIHPRILFDGVEKQSQAILCQNIFQFVIRNVFMAQ